MRKLTKNELIELRACKEIDNGEQEFYTRAKRMYEGDEEALALIQKAEDLLHEVRSMDPYAYGDSKGFQAYSQAQVLYLQHVDGLLKEMGYTPKPKKQPNDIFDILEEMFGAPDEQ